MVKAGLQLSAALYAQMLAHLRDAYPEEACGLLAGDKGAAAAIYPVENRLHSTTAFEMAPLQQLQAFMSFEEAGWVLLAIYHSHPHGPDAPSEQDISQAYYPDALSIIVSLAQPDRPAVRAFAIRDGAAEERPLTIT